jgi:hypothetical protein
MFNYVFYGKRNDKRCLVHKNDVKIEPGQEETFISLFEYDEDALHYFQQNNSLEGFRGRMRIGVLPFDIDSPKLEDACLETKHLLKDLRHWGIQSVRLSFSGSKGFHVLVPQEYFGGFEPSSEIPQQLFSLTKQLTTSKYDSSIYSHLRIFRVTNTAHSKTGLFKVPIEEGMLDDPESILEYAKTIHKPVKGIRVLPISELVDIKDRSFKVVPKQTDFTQVNIQEKKCINHLLSGVETGERHRALCVLTSHFKYLGLSEKIAWLLIEDWNQKNQETTIDDAFITTFKRVWETGYRYGCWHPELDSHCSKDCYLFEQKYKVKKAEIVQFVTMHEAKIVYQDFIETTEFIKTGISKELDKHIRKLVPGDLIGVLGRPTTYKSTVAQMMGRFHAANYKTYSLLVSLEMGLIRLYERQVQEIYDLPMWEIEEQYKNIAIPDEMSKFLWTTNKSLSVSDIKVAVKNWERTTGNKIGLILIDFLHALKVQGGEAKSRAENVMKELKDLPHELQAVGGILVHTSRGEKKDTYTPLVMGSARDSSAIEDNCDYIIGLHKVRDDENLLCMQLLKNKNGSTLDAGIMLQRSVNAAHLIEMPSQYLPMAQEEEPF